MEISSLSVNELIQLYSQTVKELKKRGILRTGNVIGELGEYLVIDFYNKSPILPTLSSVPIGTKNINAISQNGERYSIKSTSGNVTGVFYGLEPIGSKKKDTPIFEYVVICKLDKDCSLEGIYQLSWEMFLKHKKWHSRMNAWNLTLSKALKDDSTVIFEVNRGEDNEQSDISNDNYTNNQDEEQYEGDPLTYDRPPFEWNKTEKVNHDSVRKEVAKRISKIKGIEYKRMSPSRFISEDNENALFVLSASFSEKNNEYWYSINDEIFPWMELYPDCKIAFALGSAKEVLLFDYKQLKDILPHCLRTKHDDNIGKKAHYHFSFAVENNGKVYFKQKLPEKDFVDITYLLV